MSDKYRQIIEDVNAAFMRGDNEGFLDLCSDDLVWMIAGESAVRGKSAIREFLAQGSNCEPPEFSAEKILVDGESGACYGEMTMKEKDGPAADYHFCDVYTFKHGKVSELRTYIVKNTE